MKYPLCSEIAKFWHIVWAITALIRLPFNIQQCSETHPCSIPTNVLLKCYRNLFTLHFFLFLLSSLKIASSRWLTYFCCSVWFSFNYSNYSALITGIIPRMLVFFLMLLLLRLHSFGASMKPTNDLGMVLVVLVRARFQDFSSGSWADLIVESCPLAWPWETWVALIMSWKKEGFF